MVESVSVARLPETFIRTLGAHDGQDNGVNMKKWVVAYNARGNGLGNRLRVTLGARCLARARDRRLGVVWPTTPRFRPAFEDLFQGKDWIDVPISVAQALGRVSSFRDEHLGDIDSSASSLLWQIRTGAVLEVPEDVRSWEDDLRELQPLESLADQVRSLHNQFGNEPYLGVQLRTHAVSHEQTRKASPVEWFVGRLDAIRTEHPELRFYLSCDVPEVQRDLMKRYSGSLGLTDKGTYNSVEGVQSGIVDLYMLASSSYILGPAHTSFVELAVRLADHSVFYENSLKSPELDAAEFTKAVNPLVPSQRS